MTSSVQRQIAQLRKQYMTGLSLLERLELTLQKGAETKVSSPRPKPANATYSWEKFDNYSAGVHALKEVGAQPLTFRENLEARLQDKTLFDTYQDSSTAIVYSGGTKFKIDMKSKDLLGIPKGYDQSTMQADYDANKGVELDRKSDIYNQELTKEQFLAHKGWYVLFGGRLNVDGEKIRSAKVTKKMEQYAEAFYDQMKKTKGMGFYLRDNANKCQVRSLILGDGLIISSASGYNSLDINTRFVRVGPTK